MTPPDGRPTVGLLGTGRMGAAMAARLAAAGYEVVLWNRTPEPAATLAAAIDGRVVATPGRRGSSGRRLRDDAGRRRGGGRGLRGT